MSVETSPQALTGRPLNATTRSPGRSPICAAGVGALPVQLVSVASPGTMHACTSATVSWGRETPVRRRDAEQQEEGQEDVHGRSPGHDDHLLPGPLLVEQPAVVGGGDVLVLDRAGLVGHRLEQPGARRADLVRVLAARRVHADEADVAAERDRLDAVLGLAAPRRPQRLAEADEVLGGLDAEELAGDEVTDLVEARSRPSRARRRRPRRGRRRRSPSDARHLFSTDPPPKPCATRSAARARAQASAASTDSSVRSAPTTSVEPTSAPVRPVEASRRARASTGATTSTMPRNGSRTLVEGVDADLVGRVVDGGRAAPVPPGRPGELDGRERLGVQRLERPRLGPRPVHGRRGARERGPARTSASAIGSRMSGGEHWAMVEPSTNWTIECTSDCGWTTTSMRSSGTP